MERLLIFPYNGNGLDALSCLGDNFAFVGFVDDTIEKQGKSKFGFEVYSRDAFKKFPDAKILAVPGSPQSYKTRKKVIDGLKISNDRFTSVIHPNASISLLSEIGTNVLIMAGVVLTGNCKIGNNVCILPNTVVHHDSIIGDNTLIGSNITIAGNTTIGSNCYIGSGSNVINGITIGNNCLIGLGSNVIKNLPENIKAAGNPAKILE
jgi:sugar O-acyltransferase (sialic acid O-acetyltransferase NeuD family)